VVVWVTVDALSTGMYVNERTFHCAGLYRSGMRRGNGGATSALGTLLMVALVLVLVGASGVFVFDLAPNERDRTPSASVTVSAAADGENAQELVVQHDGGDALAASEFDVVVRDDGMATRTPLSTFDDRSGVNVGVVDAGDALRTPFLLSGPTTVQLVHRPSGNVLVEQSVSLPSASPSVVDMQTSDPTQSFENSQDGAGETTVENGGATVTLSGDQWKYVNYSYSPTVDTTLVFEFNSTTTGEIHGIGLEDDQSQTGRRIVQVFGVQDWGENVTDISGASSSEYYELGDGWVRYEIPIGELYNDNGAGTGDTDYLVFIMDCDGNVDPSKTSCPSNTNDGTFANAQFRNVRVYEASPVVVAGRTGPGVRAATNATAATELGVDAAANATVVGRWVR
jgi:FlaG/FlaF family flagellin (archaellin)